ncbi:MAG TPA: PPOX class F420-dependent oxidoreductase [Dehalococcoidia bacterium]|nr:PPOX class F420-dependent oxidoreductase [Dehalococcoidia bacterium]
MAVTVDDGARKLLEEPNFAFLATLMEDGSPQVTPVWVDYDGRYILVNTAEGRVKVRNVRRDPRVTMAVANRENPYHWAMFRGRVVEITAQGADEHIDKQAKKYLGRDKYPFRQPGEQRLLLKIEPEHARELV